MPKAVLYCKREDFHLTSPQLDNGSFYNLVKISKKKALENYIYNNYSAENVAIMANDENYLRRTNPSLFNGYLNNERRDRRTLMQYMQDLVASWIIEDTILTKIKLFSKEIGIPLTIKHTGCDKNRSILVDDTIAGRVTNNADFIAAINNTSIPLELSICFKESYIRLRNEKCKHLIEEKALLFHIEIIENSERKYVCKYVLVSPKYMQEKSEMEFFDKWDKYVYRLSIKQCQYRILDTNVIKYISNYIQYGQHGNVVL